MNGDILHKYSDYMAVVSIGGGYDIPSRVEKSKLLIGFGYLILQVNKYYHSDGFK